MGDFVRIRTRLTRTVRRRSGATESVSKAWPGPAATTRLCPTEACAVYLYFIDFYRIRTADGSAGLLPPHRVAGSSQRLLAVAGSLLSV